MANVTEMPIANEATEIRCQEKTKGGLRYEVILAEPTASAKRVPSPTQPSSPTLNPAAVLEKLRAAEERRLLLEAEKLATISARAAKIEEAVRKREELNKGFVETTKESLDKKLMISEEKREAHYADKKKKIKDHLEGVEKSRQSNKEHSNEEIRIAIEEKLKIAEAQREMNLKNKIERLKEHEARVNRSREVLNLQIEQSQKLDTVIKTKLELAAERRKTIERETLEKIRKCSRVDAVRSSKSKSLDNDSNSEQMAKQETASSG